MSNNTLFEDEQDKVHILMAIRRKKENDGITCKEELCFREVCYNETEALAILKARIADKPGVWRIYKTVNRRNVQMAKKLMLKWYIDGLYTKSRWNSVFTKALLQQECRAEKFALVDIDTTDATKIQAVKAVIFNKLQETYGCEFTLEEVATPNGMHIRCKPFDKRILAEFDYADVEYDRFIYVDRLTIE